MQVSLKQAGEDRKAQNQLFQGSVADQRAVTNILNKALDRLKQFYAPGEPGRVKSCVRRPAGLPSLALCGESAISSFGRRAKRNMWLQELKLPEAANFCSTLILCRLLKHSARKTPSERAARGANRHLKTTCQIGPCPPSGRCKVFGQFPRADRRNSTTCGFSGPNSDRS